MEIEEYLNYLKELQSNLLIYIEESDNSNGDYETLIDFFKKYNIPKNRDQFLHVINLILAIVNNYHRRSDFFSKIEKILLYFENDFKSYFSKEEIFKIFKNSKSLLYFLFEKNFIELDKSLINEILNESDNLCYFLLPIIKSRINKKKKQKMESKMPQVYFTGNFTDLCKLGENDSIICDLIRKDLVEEFITYVTKKDMNMSRKIPPSLFESNSFLKDKNVSLIEYAAFNGSIQIFQYLRLNNADLDPSLWLYAIHGKNAEIIHLLEEDKIEPPSNCFEESIKCHHNDIAEYIQDNVTVETRDAVDNSIFLRYYNFHFLPTDFMFYIPFLKNDSLFNIFNLYWVELKITIPPQRTIIEESLFKNISNLKEISIPSSVTRIDNKAFQKCSLLTSVHFDEDSSLTFIGDFAFEDCSCLSDIKIPPKVEKIGLSAFKCCSSLREVVIPSSVRSICTACFQRCSALETVLFEDNSMIESIGKNAFYGCNELTKISIPSSIKSVGEGALPYRLQVYKPNLLFE